MAVYKNLGPLTVGEDVQITDTVTVDGTPGGTPVNVGGWNGTLTLWTRQTDAASLYSTTFTVATAAAGIITATVPNATSLTFTDRALYYEFRRTDSGSNAVVSAGFVTFVGG